ncbi:phosphotransferase family protein [Acinetobacter lactucae]|uniref:Phosphotransferase family protein n=1 Tax=Acinetobacter lactucae TaxID=1785128 RepID=A0A429K460_9GAMM|nr:phosphotransferase family protein [Acinetobacter lactucae]RSO58809.1 phosphotransferase family protein [Acinetobacter lactucae]
MNTDQINYVRDYLHDKLGLVLTDHTNIKKMSGGAIQENWLLENQDFALVLRKNAESGVEVSSSREQEFLLLECLFQAGIKVPEPLYFEKAPNSLNSDFFIMKKIKGITEGHKLVRLSDPEQRKILVEEIGSQLARIHSIPFDVTLQQLFGKPDKARYLESKIEIFIQQLDALQRHRPILEYAINWMKKNQPKVDDLVLVHGDFRTGNLMVEGGHISGILDWEFAQWGDRREDIGWFTAKCWRFGQDQNIAGGIGSYKDFMNAYAEVSGLFIPEFEMKFWHVLSHVRWAIIAMQQSNRNNDMQIPSLELALTEFMVPRLEKNILHILGERE